jgi:hypothetical protein
VKYKNICDIIVFPFKQIPRREIKTGFLKPAGKTDENVFVEWYSTIFSSLRLLISFSFWTPLITNVQGFLNLPPPPFCYHYITL